MNERCFAEWGTDGCKALKYRLKTCGSTDCPFYKPEGCKDWIRTESLNGKIRLEPPEVYYERAKKRLRK